MTVPHTQEIAYYQRIIQKMPENTPFRINAHIRLGKLYAESGQTEAAIQQYAAAAAQYTNNGAIVKAIAANKMAEALDPARKPKGQDLIETYFKPSPARPMQQAQFDEREARDLILAQVPLFSDLETEERGKIAEFLAPVTFAKGATIIQEGELGDCMYLIQRGELDVFTSLVSDERDPARAAQERLHLSSLKAGDFFGEHALLTNEPRSATVVALTEVVLLRFAKPDLLKIIKSYPHVRDVLETYHTRRNARTVSALKAALQKVRG